jgi:hypothetical protein
VPADLGPCKAIAAGSSHTVAIRLDGTVVAWGLNTSGQCNVPADLGPCIAIAAGGGHTVAIQASPCPGDLDSSGEVDSADLGLMLLYYGPCTDGCAGADLDGSGEVDSADLGLMLLDYGPCP